MSLKNTYKVYWGEKMKWLIEAIAEDFFTSEHDYCVLLRCGNAVVRMDKVDLPSTGDTTFLLCFDTADFPLGPLVATFVVNYPDDDFPEGVRTAIEKVLLCEIVRPLTRRYRDPSKPVVEESIHAGGLSIRAKLLDTPSVDAEYEYLIDDAGNYLVDEDGERLMALREH